MSRILNKLIPYAVTAGTASMAVYSYGQAKYWQGEADKVRAARQSPRPALEKFETTETIELGPGPWKLDFEWSLGDLAPKIWVEQYGVRRLIAVEKVRKE